MLKRPRAPVVSVATWGIALLDGVVVASGLNTILSEE